MSAFDLLLVLTVVVQALGLAAATTVLGDGIHALLHVSLRLPAPWCWPGLMHRSHHLFLDEQLDFDDARFIAQVFLHQLPELCVRVVLTTSLALVFGARPAALVVVVLVWAGCCVNALRQWGRDGDHSEWRPVPPPRPGLVVDGSYHLLHHAAPEHFFGAHFSVIDLVFGRALPLERRLVVVTGGSAYCTDLAAALRAAGANVLVVAIEQTIGDGFGNADIIVLGHGSDRRGELGYEALIAATLAERSSPIPLDVWAIGNAPAWLARAGLFDDRVILRRLVRGPVLGAARTLFFLRRGVRSL